MSHYFLDTSALAKRYLLEVGSAWTLSWILPDRGNSIIGSTLTSVTLFSLISRQEREGRFTPTVASLIRLNFLFHVGHQYVTIGYDNQVLNLARSLIVQHPLRALDAIQLACAIQAQKLLMVSMTCVSNDHNLLSAAALEGFATDNPNLHP